MFEPANLFSSLWHYRLSSAKAKLMGFISKSVTKTVFMAQKMTFFHFLEYHSAVVFMHILSKLLMPQIHPI